MTRSFSFAVLGVGVGATIFAAPSGSREGSAHDSSHSRETPAALTPAHATAEPATNGAPVADLTASAVPVTGRLTLLASDGRTARDVANAVVYLEPITPPRPATTPAPVPTRPAADTARTSPAALRPMTAAPRDTVRTLWQAVLELRQTVTELRETIRQLRVQLAGGPSADPPRADSAAAPASAAAQAGGVPPNAPAAQVVAAPARARVIETESIVMRQKEFVPHVVAVEVGGAVEYPNKDPFSHNVFSSTPGGAFDLGLYPKGESRAAVFRRPGAYSIFCNIHAKMSAFVVAVPSPYYAMPTADGRFSIAAVPPGRYRVHAWHERAPQQSTVITVGERAPAELALTLDARTFRQAAHLNKFGQPYPAQGRDDY